MLTELSCWLRAGQLKKMEVNRSHSGAKSNASHQEADLEVIQANKIQAQILSPGFMTTEVLGRGEEWPEGGA